MYSLKSLSKAISRVVLVVIAVIIIVAGITVTYYYLQTTQAPPQTLTVAGWGGPYQDVVQNISKTFEPSYNVKISYQPYAGPSAVVISQLQAQWPTPTIDVVMAAPAVIVQLYQKGYLLPLNKSVLPVLQQIPDSLLLTVNNTIIGAPLYYISYGIVWRTDLIKTPIRSYSDLYNPSFKGLLEVPDPTYGTGDWLINFALWKGGNEYNMQPGFDAVLQLAKMKVIGTVYSSESDAVRNIATGVSAIGILTTSNIYQLAKGNVPINYTLYIPGIKQVVVADCIAVVKTPRAKLAFSFVNEFLNPENNQALSNGVGLPPSNMYASMTPEVAKYNLSISQVAEVGYVPDPVQKAAKINDWETWWDNNVLPLIGS